MYQSTYALKLPRGPLGKRKARGWLDEGARQRTEAPIRSPGPIVAVYILVATNPLKQATPDLHEPQRIAKGA